MKGSQFHLLPEDSFECNSGEKPIECPYEFDSVRGEIKRGNMREEQDYTLDVSANFDGETLTVEWNKDTLLVADDVIKRFQVLLHFEGHYMATTFPVPKDQYRLTVTNVLSPDVQKFNVCVEVIGTLTTSLLPIVSISLRKKEAAPLSLSLLRDPLLGPM